MDLSFAHFWGQLTANPLLMLAVALTMGVIMVNGWTDAPNAIATCVVTRCMAPKAAILMAAVFNFLGVFVMTKISNEVAVTITSMVHFGSADGQTVIIVLCAAMLAIVTWATMAWVFGIPTSESHALIAGLTGGAMAINRGGKDFLSAKLGKPVRELPRKAVKLSSPAYSSALGLLDLIIDTATSAPQGGMGSFFRSLFGG